MRPPPKNTRNTGIFVALAITLAMMFMGNDFAVTAFRPLEYLGIPFPPILKFMQVIVPAVAFTLWFLTRRSPSISAVIFLLALLPMPALMHCGDRQANKIHISKWIDDRTTLESQLGFRIWESGDSTGSWLWIDRNPSHEKALTAEMKRLGIYQP
jgi:hypothetical protein